MEQLIDKIRTPSSRAGNTVERAGKMAEAGVCLDAIAAQMTHNSKNGTKYSPRDAEVLAKVYEDCKSNVLITSAQAKAMIDDAKDGSTEFVPA